MGCSSSKPDSNATMKYEALSGGRCIEVLMRRNTANDCNTQDADYAGFDFLWPDNQPVQVNLSQLCGIGVRLVFRESLPHEGSFRVQFYLVPVDHHLAPRLAVPRTLKPRRIFFERQGPEVALHFINEFRTDVVFHQNDDPRILHWVGLNQLAEGQRQWFDLLALWDPDESNEG